MAKRNGHDKETRHTVRFVAKILANGEPTVFRYEAWCRYSLRGSMCLAGYSWTRSDKRAAEIVRKALELLNVERPPWAWGQREYTQDSTGTRISYSHCLFCGTRLPEGRLKFCATSCGDRYRAAFQTAAFHARERERALTYLQARRDRAEPKQCEACGTWFRPPWPKQRFCSRQCSGGRSMAQKMNGKKHPWVSGNGKLNGIGAGAANTAGRSSRIPPTNGNGFAPTNAKVVLTPPLSDASAPPPAPSCDANIVGNG